MIALKRSSFKYYVCPAVIRFFKFFAVEKCSTRSTRSDLCRVYGLISIHAVCHLWLGTGDKKIPAIIHLFDNVNLRGNCFVDVPIVAVCRSLSRLASAAISGDGELRAMTS